MYLYNSATHKKEEFVPYDPKLVKMYTCGPDSLAFLIHGSRNADSLPKREYQPPPLNALS